MTKQDIKNESMLRTGTLLRGIYRIDDYLSSGGFGKTYVATNVEFNERVAIKEFFMRGVNERDNNQVTVSVSNAENKTCFIGQLEKFKKEARRLRKFDNPHIVKVHDLFEENGTAYYVMDFIDGENLSERLKRTGMPIQESEVLQFLPQILDALKTVHDAKLWHLDLKPANIMVDKKGIVKLIDFGSSKQIDPRTGKATTKTDMTYTEGYAPREQMEADYSKIGAWTDIYALGATLFTLLTNQHPPKPLEIDDDFSEDKHVALPMPNIGESLKELIIKMMKTNRTQRPQKISDINWALLVNTNESKDEQIVVPPLDEETSIIEKPEDGKSSNEKLYKYLLIVLFAGIIAFVTFSLYNRNKEQEINPVSESDIMTIYVDNLSFNMVRVDGGTFTMGVSSEQDTLAYYKDEMPTHSVTLQTFYIGEKEITQELWQKVMLANPSGRKKMSCPVETVSWDDCMDFINQLNKITGKNFRLPTEAEWEYAARGGNKSNMTIYSGGLSINNVGWFSGNSRKTTHEVGKKIPNELGIYDMSGNVWEWCQDWYGTYSSSPQNNPTGPSSGSYRVIRGGSFNSSSKNCRVSSRSYCHPQKRYGSNGLRLALSVPYNNP